MSSNVVIFRKRLLAWSETFIANQGRLLPRYHPVFAGYKRDASGIDLIADSPQLLLEDCTSVLELSKLRIRLGAGVNREWLSAIRQTDPGLIHAHFLKDGTDATLIGKQLALPVVTTVHGHDVTKAQKSSWLRKDSRYFFDHVDRVIAVSDFIAGQALARGCPEHKLVTHRIGIDLQNFSLAKNESQHPSLLFIGRLVEKKGCTYLLQAMGKLTPRFPDLKLTIVGDGDLGPALKREAESLQLNVDFVGRQDGPQIRQRLSQCWLFVAPSITAKSGDAEGLPTVFMEAQALSTPVVSFRGGGVNEAIADEKTGLLCAEKDVDALADNIAALLENSSLRHEMGRQARIRAEECFDIRKQCVELERIYDEVRARS